MRRGAILTVGIVGLTLGVCWSPASADLITFDGVPSVGSPNVTVVNSEDYTFTSQHFHLLNGNNPFIVRNASPVFIGHEGGTLGSEIAMVRDDAAPFNLAGFDMAELWIPGQEVSGYPNATDVLVQGQYAGGGSISQTFSLDGIADGLGGVDDFQAVVMGAGWTNLESVIFNGVQGGLGDFGFSIDNISAQSMHMPAPGAALLGLIGLGMVGCVTRRIG
jgi:hypothetical protein